MSEPKPPHPSQQLSGVAFSAAPKKSDETPKKKPSLMKLLIGILILDLWVFGPIRKLLAMPGQVAALAAKRKTGPPFITLQFFGTPRPPERKKRKGKVMADLPGKGKSITWIAAAVFAIALIAILAMSGWAWLKPKLPALPFVKKDDTPPAA